VGTQWLFNGDVDRSKLGTGNMGLSNDQSGILARHDCLQKVKSGDVALLKGDGWYGNHGLGIAQRSPAVPLTEK